MRERLVAEARSWLGTRYHHLGRVKGVGVDCIGFVGGVALACGISNAPAWAQDRALAGYSRQPNPTMLLDACRAYLEPVAGTWQIADVLVLQMPRDDAPRHFALISELDPLYIVHAYAQARKVVETRFEPDKGVRVHSAWRFRGL